MTNKKPPPNPRGREGDKLKIDLPFDEAIRAAIKSKPPSKETPPKKA